MKISWWEGFVIQTAIGFARQFLAGNDKLTPQQKDDLGDFIEAGTKVVTDFL